MGTRCRNPYYAKSGGLANWKQGWIYARLYFGAYFVLLAAVAASWPVVRGLRRRAPAAFAPRTAAALAFAGVAALLTILYVIRVGGDFMFGRFFLPVTPFLLLGLEAWVQWLPRWWLRLAAAALVVALVVYGGVRKHARLVGKRQVAGIVDEPQFYPESRMREVRASARRLGECLAGTQATLIVQGGQASLAYYARYPVAIERYGLTDPVIAHSPLRRRERPGHEKYATADYIYARRVNLRINYRPVRSAPMYSLIELAKMSGEIIVYDRALMEHFKTCPGARFLDFPRWLADSYLPGVPSEPPQKLLRDWNHFQLFYFDHNPDPEGLRERLRAALAARGLTRLPERGNPTGSFEDAGQPSAP